MKNNCCLPDNKTTSSTKAVERLKSLSTNRMCRYRDGRAENHAQTHAHSADVFFIHISILFFGLTHAVNVSVLKTVILF